MAAGSVVSFRLPVGELLRLENDRAQGVRVGRFRLAELLDSIFHRFGNFSGLPERGCVFTVSSKYEPVSVTTVTRFSDPDHQPPPQPSAGLHALTFLAISHTMSSNASDDDLHRVLVSADQQKWLAVRTRIALVPPKSPACHQCPAVFTFQPRA